MIYKTVLLFDSSSAFELLPTLLYVVHESIFFLYNLIDRLSNSYRLKDNSESIILIHQLSLLSTSNVSHLKIRLIRSTCPSSSGLSNMYNQTVAFRLAKSYANEIVFELRAALLELEGIQLHQVGKHSFSKPISRPTRTTLDNIQLFFSAFPIVSFASGDIRQVG
jgi:hypothetical protein